MVILSLGFVAAFAAAAAVPGSLGDQPIQKPSPSRENLPQDLVDAVDRLILQKAPEATRPAYPATEEWDEPGAIRPA